jgi:alkanesulfonate monooxygenase SsuD/methylene tetrahydromethanopterin reductase-like flavin-dependent oxidoreductase (luciferase family)
VLEEQLELVHDGHWKPGPFSFEGSYYTIKDLQARPQPYQRPHPPLIMGGAAGPRAARLAARFADEYNTVMPTLDQIRERRANIRQACEAAGRQPIPFSVMTTAVLGADEADYEERVRELKAWTGQDPNPETMIVGTLEQAAERLREYEEAGVERIFLQHLLHRDIEMVELIGKL